MEQYLENLKKEKRAFYLVQIRKENNEKIFAIKRNNFLLKENENETLMNNSSIEENINVNFIFFVSQNIFTKDFGRNCKFFAGI